MSERDFICDLIENLINFINNTLINFIIFIFILFIFLVKNLHHLI